MIYSSIVPSSAGTLSVAAIALVFFIFQTWISVKEPDFRWNRWGAALSFITALYSVAVFIQFNTPAGALNHFSELLQYTVFLLLIHSVYGFTFSYLAVPSKKYHQIAGTVHAILIVTLWTTGLVIGDGFVYRDFIWLEKPYIEPELGPIGPFFLFYAAAAGAFVFTFWLKYRKRGESTTIFFLIGFLIWAVLGVHDAMATLGAETIQFLMEYGFLGFSTSIMSVTLKKYVELYEIAEARKIELQKTHDQLELRVKERTAELNRLNEQLLNEVSERMRSEAALRQSEERLLRAQAVSRVGNWELDLKTGKVWGSKEAIKIYGLNLTSPFLPLEEVQKMVHNEDRSAMDKALEELIQANKKYDMEYRLYRSDGSSVTWIHSKAELQYDNQGNPVKVLGAIQDITERKLAEQEKYQLQKQLAQAQKMEAIGTLAGGVAHDLNNILSVIVGYPDLLIMDLPEDSPLADPVMEIKKSGEKAATIVQDLLTLARRGVEATDVLNLNQIIKDYLNSHEFKELEKYHKKVRIDYHLDDKLLNILGSPIHLFKTVMNLVSNAAEAMPAGGQITITSGNRYVDRPIKGYDNFEEGDYVVLEVADTGVGISEENIKRIFEPFYTKKIMGRSGTGLGMAVVWGTVKDHKGYIDVQSEEGQGTVIQLYFPVTREDLREESYIPIENYTGSGELILIIDDVKEQRKIASRMLEKLKYRVETVASGEEGVEFVKNESPDLLVLDMIMDPGIDGYDTYKQILDIRPNQKAIIASGFAENERVRDTRKLGAGQYIKKPYTLEKIGLAVKEELMKQ